MVTPVIHAFTRLSHLLHATLSQQIEELLDLLLPVFLTSISIRRQGRRVLWSWQKQVRYFRFGELLRPNPLCLKHRAIRWSPPSSPHLREPFICLFEFLCIRHVSGHLSGTDVKLKSLSASSAPSSEICTAYSVPQGEGIPQILGDVRDLW